MNVQTLASRLGVPPRTVSRAQELFKLAAAKLGSGGPGINCRAAVCLELACAATKHFVDREQLIRLSGANKKAYLSQLGALGGALDVRPVVTVAELALKFGCTLIVPSAERCLATYKARLVAPLGARAVATDFSRPVFPAAAFYLVARSQKVPISKPQLCAAVGIDSSDLGSVLAAMEDLCKDLVGTRTPATAGRKRQRPDGMDSTCHGDAAVTVTPPAHGEAPCTSPPRRSPRLLFGTT